jgi:hypothetical protein
MSDNGKGSSPRPYSVPKEKFNDTFDKIFGEKRTYCDVCNKKFSWCSCKEVCESIDNALGIKRKRNESIFK